MFRKISYLCMLGTVLLSWGVLISFARSADQAEASGVQAATAEGSRVIVGDYTPRRYLTDKLAEMNGVTKEAKLRRAVAATSTVRRTK